MSDDNLWVDLKTISEIKQVTPRALRISLNKGKYVYRETDPNKFSPMFIEAYSSYLAYLTTMPICGDEKIKADMLQIYQRDLNRARSFSAIQNSGKTYLSDGFINARVNGTVD